MSVDFFDCQQCGETVCECGHFIHCGCGEKWCSERCAKIDGWKYDEDNFQVCNYCQEKDIHDNELVGLLLKYLKWTREEAIEFFKDKTNVI